MPFELVRVCVADLLTAMGRLLHVCSSRNECSAASVWCRRHKTGGEVPLTSVTSRTPAVAVEADHWVIGSVPWLVTCFVSILTDISVLEFL